ARPPAAGAVLRRQPPPDGPRLRSVDWDLAPVTLPSVDTGERLRNRERQVPASRVLPSVDTEDYFVDIGDIDDFGDFDDLQVPAAVRPALPSSSVDTGEPGYASPSVPTVSRLKEPKAYRPGGRSGPDEEVVRMLRDAQKKRVIDRARAAGRDPNAGAKEVVPG